ncbi:MAG: XrtA/PEP-CTERM system TPR-repeat protein PrsT [Pseudomonadota bacterium]
MHLGPTRSLSFSALIGTYLLVAASVCFGQDAETVRYYEDARERYFSDDVPGAIIQLKNALQREDGHVPSLVLLGELLLETGQAGQAAALLSEALLLGADDQTVTILLVDAYLRSAQFYELLRTLPLENASRAIRPELLAAHAQAMLGLGRNNEAEGLIAQAKEADRTNFRADLANATLLLRRGDTQNALSLTQLLVDRAPDDTRVWNARASTLQVVGRRQEAITAFQRALDLRPGNVDARLSLAAILIELDRNDEAAAEVAYLRENFPGEPRAAFYDALLASKRGDSTTSNEALAEAVNGIELLDAREISGNLQLLMVGALSNFGQGGFERAREFLERYLAINPDDAGASRLMATTYIAIEEPQKAMQILLRLHSRYPQDRDTTALLANAYSELGEYDKAAELLEQLSGSDDDPLAQEARLGLMQLNAGRVLDSIETLEAVIAGGASKQNLEIPLALAYMRAGRWEDARRILARLAQEQPDDDNVLNLLSLCYLSLGEDDLARDAMETLIARSPRFLPAYINLAKLQTANGKMAEAENLLKSAQLFAPEDARVVAGQAELALQQGRADDALRFAERALQLEPANTEYAKFLVGRYLEASLNAEAENTAKRASTAGKDNFEGGILYGQTLAILGKPKQASLVYTQLARGLDFDLRRLVIVARLQSSLGEHESAITALTTAMNTDSSYRPAHRDLISAFLAAGRPEDSLNLANDYQVMYPDDPFGILASAEASFAQANYPLAEKEFKAAIELGSEDLGSLGLYRIFRRNGDLASAKQIVQARADETDDLRVLAALSDILIATQDWNEAERVLTRILEQQDAAWAHWNNRAFVRQTLGRREAEDDARRAHQLAPESASVNDTLGWILVQQGRASEALQFLREAAARDSSNPAIRYHLGAALAKLGRGREAERELFFALEYGHQWLERPAAETLLAELRRPK